jgi:hypothetical protein
MATDNDLYRQILASKGQYFNTCFYCGCVATEEDMVPPLKFASFYLTTREDADFYRVPACKECFEFLKNDRSGLLGQRVDNLKSIRVYEMWDHSEIEELDYSLKHSINAGINLGKESYDRYKFRGFDFEVNGERHIADYVKAKKFVVFGETFFNFRDALDYGCKAFRVPKAKLLELFAEHENSFDKAIRFFQAEVARKLYENELKKKCGEFAKTHKLNINFVMHTVELYRKQNDELSIELALVKLFEERLKK